MEETGTLAATTTLKTDDSLTEKATTDLFSVGEVRPEPEDSKRRRRRHVGNDQLGPDTPEGCYYGTLPGLLAPYLCEQVRMISSLAPL